jgi:hypothetical protein
MMIIDKVIKLTSVQKKSYGEGVQNGLVGLITQDRLFVVLTSILRWIERFEFSRLINRLTCEVMLLSSYKRYKIFLGVEVVCSSPLSTYFLGVFY